MSGSRDAAVACTDSSEARNGPMPMPRRRTVGNFGGPGWKARQRLAAAVATTRQDAADAETIAIVLRRFPLGGMKNEDLS